MNVLHKTLIIGFVVVLAGLGVALLLQGARAAAGNLPSPQISIEKSVDPASNVQHHAPVTYELRLSNTGLVSDSLVLLTDTLPAEVDFAEWLLQPPGAVVEDDVLTWSGAITSGQTVTFTFSARHTGKAGEVVNNTVEFSGTYQTGSASAAFTVQPVQAFLPSVASLSCSDFFDDFSHPDSGWWVGEDADYRSEYLNGEYRVVGKNPGWVYMFGAPSCGLENYSVEADMRWGGNSGSLYGLTFGIVGDYEQFYTFMVNTDYHTPEGYPYELFRYSGETWTELTYGFSRAIQGGTASNHLKVSRIGTSITLIANGTTLTSWTDGAIAGETYTGVIVVVYEDLANADARFDDFTVTRAALAQENLDTSREQRSAPVRTRNKPVYMAPEFPFQKFH